MGEDDLIDFHPTADDTIAGDGFTEQANRDKPEDEFVMVAILALIMVVIGFAIGRLTA